jgi:DNA-binding beta-propeller fold protein YncE
MAARKLGSVGRVMLCALAGALALAGAAPAAQAEVPKLISYGNFPDSGSPIGVAVDQSTEDVYAAGVFDFTTFKSSQINKFDASGKLLSPPSPIGEESEYSGMAVNPTSGELYVVNNVVAEGELKETAIDTYDPSNDSLLSSFSVPESHNLIFGNYTGVEIAADSAGNVYVPVLPESEVLKYSPTGTLLQTFTGSGASTLKEPTGVAVSPSGDLWIADAGNSRVEELSPSGAFITEVKSEGSQQTVALDAHGDLFVDTENGADFCGSLQAPCLHVVEYSPAGAQLADIGAGSIGEMSEEPRRPLSTLAVNDSNGRVYVTDGGKDLIWVFGPPAAPVIGNELAAEVSPSEAKLGALINPGGIETNYRVEYGTTAEYGNTTPFPEGNVGQGVTSRTVWAAAKGLAPDTTYHYRVVATNELGTIAGPDRTFTTEAAQETVCSNEQMREGFSADLPDCRAYELVTPSNKDSTQPDDSAYFNAGGKPGRGNKASVDGDRMMYEAYEVVPGSDSGSYWYISTRGLDGWAPENVLPRQSYTGDRCIFYDTNIRADSPDLTEEILVANSDDEIGERPSYLQEAGCGAEPVEVVSGEPQGVENLLLRNNVTGVYQLINITPPGVAPADAHFQAATEDLSHVCFSEHAPLTPDAPADVENEYEWVSGVLRLVTAESPAECQMASSVNEAAGYSYSVSGAVLTGGEANERGEVAQSGQPNLYVKRNGVTMFIAILGENEIGGCVHSGTCARVSPEGAFFAFISTKSLTGYDNIDVNTGRPDPEMFIYSAASDRLACASCDPSGEAPMADGTEMTGEGRGGNATLRYLSAGGRLFFETAEGLLPSDTNGQDDVYEYEAGQLHLISTGTSSKESELLDASESGGDVFFMTRQALLAQDTDAEGLSIYDARVDGGFPALSSPPACVTADACRAPSALQPSIFGAPASSTFSGAGNLAPPVEAKSKPRPKAKAAKCKKGFVKRRGRCVREPGKKAKRSIHVNKRAGK